MKITDVRTVLLTGPISDDPWIRKARELRSAAFVVVETDAGVQGVGETYAGYFCPELVPGIVEYYKPILVGQTLDDVRLLWERMDTCGTFWARVGLGSIVLCGIEAALWDLRGKAEGKPVCELLGGPRHEALPCYATGGPSNGPIDKLCEKVASYRALGFKVVKLGAGWLPEGKPHRGETRPSAAADLETNKLAALRGRFGESVRFAIDAHMNNKAADKRWSLEAAIAVAQACEPFDLLFIEEALPYRHAAEYAALRQASPVPIAGGECLTSLAEWSPYVDADAFDIAQPDASFTSGLAQIVELAGLLARRGRRLAPHAWGAGGCLMQNVHVGFACDNTVVLELPPAPGPLHTEVYREPLRIEDGRVLPPTAPGLGVTLTQHTIERFPFLPGTGEVVAVPGKPPHHASQAHATTADRP